MDEQVAQALRGTWSADANTRMAAEIRLGELQAQGGALSFDHAQQETR